MKKNGISFIFIRYLILLALALFNLYFIYLLFTPVTLYPVILILKLFYSALVIKGTTIIFDSHMVSLIPACIAGSAYYLLIFLNLSTPMPLEKRVKSLSFVILAFLFLNILRITIFFSLFVSDFSYFDISHRLVWYLGSTIMVIGIWFASVYLFRIKEIPVYSDFSRLISLLCRER